MMPDNATTDESESAAVRPGGTVDDDGDIARRRRSGFCDARQLLSETLRLRRAAQLQRAAAAAGETGTPAATPPTVAVSGLRRSAATDAATAGTPKRRKRLRQDRGSATDRQQQPQPPRARRIMFHEYKGPPEDGSAETATAISGPSCTAHQLAATPSTPSLYFASPSAMTPAFSPVWNERKDEQPRDGGSSNSFGGPLTADFGGVGFRPTSSTLPRFSELQRSLCSSAAAAAQRHDFVDLISENQIAMMQQRSRPDAVGCPGSAASGCQHPSTLVDAMFCRSATTTGQQLTTSSSSLSSSSSSLSSSSVEQSTQSQRCHPQSVTSPMDINSGLLFLSGVTTCFPSVTSAYRPNNGNRSLS